MRTPRDPTKPKEPQPKLPALSTKEGLFVALWRFQMELDGLDWKTLELSPKDLDEAKALWARLVASLRAGLAKTMPPP